MNRLACVLVLAACGGGGSDDEITVAFTAPAAGSELARDSLDDLGALVAMAALELDIGGAPTRVAVSLDGAELAEVDADGRALAILDLAGPVTLTATAFDDAGDVAAVAELALVISDPAIATCQGWLDLYGVAYTVGPARAGVVDPVTSMMPINGIPYRSGGALRTTMFGDCSLIKSLAEAAPSLRRRNLVEVTDLGVYNYRCIGGTGTPPNCPNGVSQHAYGNAIDIAAVTDADGTKYAVLTDWVIDPASEKTCEAGVEPGKDALLHELICELKANMVWNIVLTPNYNADHRDHFHVDLKEGSDFIRRTAAAPGVMAERATFDLSSASH